MITRRQAFRQTFSWRSVQRSLLSALVVGTVVNGINQGPELISGYGIVLWKLAFTYTVPFLVVSYGTFGALRQAS
jgi:hypothetical protein